MNSLTKLIWQAMGGPESALSALSFTGEGNLASAYPVSDLAAASIAAAALSIAELVGRSASEIPAVNVNRRLSSFWFAWSIHPVQWEMPAPWDPIAGDYRTRDGWIRLHTNAPHHRRVAEKVLGRHSDKSGMSKAVGSWTKSDLEAAVIEAGGCAAEMRSAEEWAIHPQGAAVANEPLAHLQTTNDGKAHSLTGDVSRPLGGLRVLDLTRVLAGPVATRFLAGYGADVLRIDPPDWDEPGVVPEVTLGKRCARLNLSEPAGREQFEILLSQADILVHGYRPEALQRLGYGPEVRCSLRPGLIDISLNAYGWSGPWATRRGFDSLVQMSAGIADRGMRWKRADKPVPLPVQALDHAAGYLLAASAVRALAQRLDTGRGTEARLSLARTASLLACDGDDQALPNFDPETIADLSSSIEHTDWGPARRLLPPVTITGTPMHWTEPARALGSATAEWL